MIIKLTDLTKAVAKIQAMASGEKTVPGIMFDISDEGLKICYSDSRKALIEKIDVVIEEDDIQGKIVMDYGRVVSAIAICQPSGRLRIEDIHFDFEEDGKVTLYADKMLLVQRGDESELQKVSTFEQVLTWAEAGSNMRTALLSRENYEGIFNPAGPVDEIDSNLFKDILNKTSTEKGKQIYFSPANDESFVCNLAYVTSIPLNGEFGLPVVISTATGKCVADIINRLDEEKIYMHMVDNKFCKVYTEDQSFGMSFEVIPANRTHLNTLDRYKSKDYTSIQLTFFKEILQNVIKSALAVSASEKVSLKLEKNTEDDSVELVVIGSNTNASIENNYRVITNGFNFKNNEAEGVEDKLIKEFDIPIALKVLSDIINKCDTDYIAFDISYEEGANAKAIRIAEVDIDKLISEQDAVLSGTNVQEEPKVEEVETTEEVVAPLVVGVEQPEELVQVEHPTAVVKDTVNIGEFQKAKTVTEIYKVGGASKGEAFEIEETSEDAIKGTSNDSFEITMNDKLNFRERTLGSKHYTLAAK